MLSKSNINLPLIQLKELQGTEYIPLSSSFINYKYIYLKSEIMNNIIYTNNITDVILRLLNLIKFIKNNKVAFAILSENDNSLNRYLYFDISKSIFKYYKNRIKYYIKIYANKLFKRQIIINYFRIT